MGRTLDTFTRLVDRKKSRLKKFRRALRKEDQEVFDELFASARYHAAAGAYSGDSVPFEIMLLAMLIEQQKEVNRLRKRISRSEVPESTILDLRNPPAKPDPKEE